MTHNSIAVGNELDPSPAGHGVLHLELGGNGLFHQRTHRGLGVPLRVRSYPKIPIHDLNQGIRLLGGTFTHHFASCKA